MHLLPRFRHWYGVSGSDLDAMPVNEINALLEQLPPLPWEQ